LARSSWSLCIASSSSSIIGPLSWQSHTVQLSLHSLWLSYWHWRPPIILSLLPGIHDSLQVWVQPVFLI
jgi:hypothetical protein